MLNAPSTQDRRILVAAAAVVFLVAFDASLLTVALPAITKSFPAFSTHQTGWVISAYSITLAALLTPAGYIGDRWGRRAALSAGLVIFGLGAVCCAISGTITQLILSRCLQALGGACALPASLTVVLASFEPSERPGAVGKWSAAGGLATALGPPIAAGLMYVVSWRAMFWIHIPLVTVVLYGAQKFLQESKGKKGSLHLSWGIGIIAAGVGYLVTVITAPWAFAHTASNHNGFFIAILIALGGYLCSRNHSFRRDFLQWRRVWVFVAILCFGAVFGALLVAFDLILVYKFDFSISMAALLLSPVPLLSIPAATIAGWLQREGSSYRALSLGACTLLCGAVLFVQLCNGAELHWHLGACIVLFAAGIGLCFPALTIQATQAISNDLFALGCALTQALRHIGTALGVALITSSAQSRSFRAPALTICGLCIVMMAALVLSAVSTLLRGAAQDRRRGIQIEPLRAALTFSGTVFKTKNKL
jgi:MFS family permease